jgi:hypothetical protein
MREEDVFVWKIKWGGRWTKTSVHLSEAAVRKEHPEALCLHETRKTNWIAETDEEHRELARKSYNPTSTRRVKPD